MKNHSPRRCFIALVAGLLACVLGPSSGVAMDIRHPEIPAPLETLTGQPVPLSDYRNRVRLVNFSASGCPPYMVELPSFQTLKPTLVDEPFEILALNNRVAGNWNVQVGPPRCWSTSGGASSPPSWDLGTATTMPIVTG